MPNNVDSRSECQYIKQGIRLVESEYLRVTNSFLPPPESAESCWDSYESLVNEYEPNFDIRRRCGFETTWIARGCMNITTRSEFESVIPRKDLDDIVSACNQSLLNSSPCATCTTAISWLQASHLTGPSIGNVSDCTAYPSIYVAAFANLQGPTNEVFWFFRRRRKKFLKPKSTNVTNDVNTSSGLDSISGSTTLIRFKFDEIKAATKNFSWDNIIGRGGYGNVYKGVLPDGSEVALKRFKNCSASGDASFTHEVEVIASIRHVNLVALRGYCTATTPYEGHQRIIVCDLLKNGSVHDHLFGLVEKKLSWPIRQKIALGTAKGLSYLHYGAQPAIIHRDIKASNILLDERFEPKVADFGLAKFNPEGLTHLSTRVAGTMGYVAPEYALYGQLTERSDVYSFGVVLLELLSGKKALVAVTDGQPTLITDWAWSLVRNGKALDVVEDMPDLGPPVVVEKYVLVAVLCSHPQLYARPTMDQVVKLLDTDVPVPSIPGRPISVIANIDDIERLASSSGSGNLSTPAGYQPYTFDEDCPQIPKEDNENSSGSDGISIRSSLKPKDIYTNEQYIHLASEEHKKKRAENSLQEDIKVPLVSQEKKLENGNVKEERCMVYLTTFVAVCGSYAFGSCAGYSSPTQSAIREDLSLSLAEYSLFGSILTFGAMIGAITSGKIADYIGRKGAMTVSSGFCVAGWLAIYFAKGSLPLDIGRLSTGYGMGVFSYVVPVYIAEIAPKDLRGALTTINQLMICTAVSVSFIIGTFLTWRALAITGIVPCAILLVGLVIIPESPRWLAKNGNQKEFEAALRRLRGKNASISEETAEIQDYIETLEKLPKAKLLDLFQKRYRSSVMIGVGLMVCQQLGGINGICFYTSSIFESSGFPANIGTIVYAILQVIITALGATLIDRAGRKPLLLVSAFGLVLGCLLTGSSYYLKEQGIAANAAPALAVTGILVYIGAFSAGMGAVPWVVMSEIFPINIKGVAGSLATFVNWFGAWACSYTFNFLMSWSSYGKQMYQYCYMIQNKKAVLVLV
ncbi:probable LRR receptor-like serine threonine-kinase RKF3 [Olea europaea subsp. europaea]|uniref:non-specific serine/threonine protein kinase n=1 Tax=Olea europaea subsp. europaea TaxID=158383 RepID=A0A8S0PC97_OLEEU|nr:probable LRR receptor-like serine threonine-kinase RKF3 [Olea europaea subsp. europaea]